MKKSKNKTLAKVKKTHKCIINFLTTTNKNYVKMKQAIKKIWAGAAIAATLTACNVTRVMTNESQYFQRGDTAVTIQTKTIETYSAERKN